ncbi:MAG: DUF1998 domain-containing protein, partial [Pseudomonadales bacterium]|nr:DUF1998 domain-containing protein [Pseudomonadales bacterium]
GVEQENCKNKAFSTLNERWAFAPDEKLETSRFLITERRPESRGKPRTDLVTGGPRSRILKQIKTASFWKETSAAGNIQDWKEQDWAELIQAMLDLSSGNYVLRREIDKNLIGYKLNAAALEWRLDTEIPASTSRANAFFRHLYLSVAETLKLPEHSLFDFEAQEHTAQVDAGRRQLLEQRFRYTEKDRQQWAENPAHEAPLERLSVMFCSPTMELGVDISALNTVYLRNVPPTPANYAQRSGRAGRSGQQAIVVTYCASLSPHDQWFFHNANEMVHGVVKAPTLDLGNRDLIESHLQAVWLACAEVQLETSIAPLVDLEGVEKPLISELMEKLSDPAALKKAKHSAHGVIAQMEAELDQSHWFTPEYVDTVINNAPENFSGALQRWRSLFDATRTQMDMADKIVKSHTATHSERQNAQRRYGDAARQYAILLKAGNTQNSDFYTYRYLASQGFLPGYNFPRLPLMAWIPARGGQSAMGNDDEGSMVSRPRFLALSEFGPRSLIYHQGRMYRVVRAKLNVGNVDHVSSTSQLATLSSRVCSQCGYGHMGQPDGSEPIMDRCENCDALLTEDDWVKELYRIETVETLPVERISINDEDRQRQGFELQTTYRFLPGQDGKIQHQKSLVLAGDDTLAEINYAPAAQIWRINRGWRRRKDKNLLGFYINPISGTWSKDDSSEESTDAEKDAGLMDKVPNQRIVPFVEDYRNILILSPLSQTLSIETMATVQAALKRGIELTFQIEESELVAEPLPKQDDRKSLLFYEAAEGGAGVLTRLAHEPESLALVAGKALEVMHFQKPEGKWDYSELENLEIKDTTGQRLCEAGCYQCLLSYFNQPDHEHINRRDSDALKLLVALANAQVIIKEHSAAPPEGISVATGTDTLSNWLKALENHGIPVPDQTNLSIGGGEAIADAQYKVARTLIFLQSVDSALQHELADKGWLILDFSEQSEWETKFSELKALIG